MTARPVRALALLLLLAAAPVRADVVLPGNQHIGDGENASFSPRDPVERAQMQANPTHFHLTQTTVLTAVRLDNVDDLDSRLQIFIDDMTTPLAGTLSGTCNTGAACTYTLAAPLVLTAGTHTIFPDPGCTPGTFTFPCTGGENDFWFTGITLIAAQTSGSRSFHRRFHLGGSTDADDDYGGRWYPDAPDGGSVEYAFTLEISRVLSEIRFYRLRDVAASALSRTRVLIDGVPIGTLTANGNPFILSSGLALAAGAHTLRIEGGLFALGDLDDMSWDDIVLVMANNPVTSPGAFNAVDELADAAAGAIQTKVAGAAFDLDLVALSGGVQFVGYTGTVNVALVDASDATSSCFYWPPLKNLGDFTFVATDNGRKTVTTSYANAARDVRVRIYEPTLGITNCSVDNFAIRPAYFGGISATHLNSTTAGDAEALASGGFGPNTTPIHRAGRPFTVRATAYNATDAVATTYAGSPTLRAASILLPGGGTLGSATTTGAWSYPSAGAVRTDGATYSEVGAVRLELLDSTFAAVDADDTFDPGVLWVGPQSFDVGRFVPDRFTFAAEDLVTPPTLLTGCGGFSYLGQPISFSPTPVRFSITAVNASGDPTTNYDGVLYKLPAAIAAATTFPATGGSNMVAVGAPAAPAADNVLANQGNGVTRFELSFTQLAYPRGAPVVPFEVDVAVVPGALGAQEADGVDFAVGATYGQAAAGLGVPFIGTGGTPKQLRFGRMTLLNAHGSENLPLDVPLRTEYWASVAGGDGFVQNLQDSCTTLPQAEVDLSGVLADGAPNPDDTSIAVTYTGLVTNGVGAVPLTAPGDTGQVLVRPDLTGANRAWLKTDDADGDTAYDDDPLATATFGVAARKNRRIFQREVISN